MRTGPTNPELKNLIMNLKKLSIQENKKLWKRIATDLEKPTRSRRIVNLIKIDRYAKEDEIALVPGKVLAGGDLTKKTTIAAYQFSDSALEKINKIGKAITIKELMEQNPKANKVRVIG
jgi:large subunit ribosomal protein L18e